MAEQHREEKRDLLGLKIKELKEKATAVEPVSYHMQEDLDDEERLCEVEDLK